MNVRDDIELYDVTAAEALGYASKQLVKETGISLKDAKKIVYNAVCYDIIINDIIEQAKWLMNMNQEEDV